MSVCVAWLPLVLAVVFAVLPACPGQKLSQLHQNKILGCPVLSRGRLSKEGLLKLTVDPIMCVYESNLTGALQSRYDFISKQSFISIPVMLAENAIKGILAVELREVAALSEEFATVTRVTARSAPGSVFSVLGFLWSQGESIGYLRIGCDRINRTEKECKIDDLVSSLRSKKFSAISRVLVSATLQHPVEGSVTLDYRVTVAGSGQGEDYSVSSRTSSDFGLPDCASSDYLALKPIRSVRVGQCSSMVYKANEKGSYVVESPICFVGVSGTNGDEMFDESTGKYRVTLLVKVASKHDESAKSEVRQQLKEFEPTRLTFMELWGASRSISAFLAGRYEIGQLVMKETNDGSGQVHVHCNHLTSCRYLVSQIRGNPLNFWRHVAWQPTYRLPISQLIYKKKLISHCSFTPPSARYSVLMIDSSTTAMGSSGPGSDWEVSAWKEACARGGHCQYEQLIEDGRHFLVFQRRLVGSISFERPWSDYVRGFGDANDFWIGLTALHHLTSHGTTLRMVMSLWNSTDMIAEYSDFTVGDASTNYRMRYRTMIQAKSNVNFDAMETHNGMKFSTYDRDYDFDDGSCSLTWGRGGWWFNRCYKVYLNGLFQTTILKDWKYNIWVSNTDVIPLKQVKMMLQI